jgi:hypothetical protein
MSEMEPQVVDQQARKIQAFLDAFIGLSVGLPPKDFKIVFRIGKFSKNIAASFFVLHLRTGRLGGRYPR